MARVPSGEARSKCGLGHVSDCVIRFNFTYFVAHEPAKWLDGEYECVQLLTKWDTVSRGTVWSDIGLSRKVKVG